MPRIGVQNSFGVGGLRLYDANLWHRTISCITDYKYNDHGLYGPFLHRSKYIWYEDMSTSSFST